MNNYNIYEEIGRGKFSAVYKGRRKKTIDYVAVKSVEKSRRKKVLNEVKIFHNLSHPNVLKFDNWYETRNHLWIIFEYCTGGDLLNIIDQDKKLPETSVRHFGRDLAEGLNYLHSRGVIFADLKPTNVLANEYNQLKLSDFGLARKVDAKDVDTTQGSKGTPSYMAPELLSNKQSIYSFFSDIWALGIVLFQMATGHTPFSSNSLKELITQILDSPTPKVTEFSDSYNDLLQRLLQKDPTRRATWSEIRNHPFFDGEEITSYPLPTQPQFDQYLRSRGLDPHKFWIQKESVVEGAATGKKEEHGLHSEERRSDKTSSTASKSSGGSREENILRLSQNVQHNLLRENQGYGDTPHHATKGDVKLSNPNQVLDFTEEQLPTDKIPIVDVGLGGDNIEDLETPFEALPIGASRINPPRNIDRDKLGAGRTIGNDNEDEEREESTDRKALSIPVGWGPGGTTNESTRAVEVSSGITRSQLYMKELETIMMHNSDTTVKPIIGNREIESSKPQEVEFRRESLPFDTWTAEDFVANIETQKIDQHLSDIYSTLASSHTLNETINVLLYFESLVQNTPVSNRLINTVFMHLLVRMLKNVQSPFLKIRLCSIIGHLIRYATMIDNDLVDTGLLDILVKLLHERNDKVKRKAIAAAGEYLFYAATQLDDEYAENQVSVWEISTTTITGIMHCLKEGEEEVVRFYACKTIENITAQSVTAGQRFATQEALQLLLEIYLNIQNECLKTSAAVAIFHICRLNEPLFRMVIDILTPSRFFATFNDGPLRIQQAFITMLLFAAKRQYIMIQDDLTANSNSINCLLPGLEQPSIVIKGKCLLTLAVLFKQNPYWLAFMSKSKFYTLLDRLLRDNFKYVKYCYHYLLDSLVDVSLVILKLISDDFNNCLKDAAIKTPENSLYETVLHILAQKQIDYPLKGNMILIVVLQELIATQSMKSLLINHRFIQLISHLIEYSEIKPFPGQTEFKEALLLIVEGMSTNSKILIQFHEPIMKSLLPALLSKIESKSADTRCLTLKIFTDIILQYLNEENIYDPEQASAATYKTINELILKQLLPNYGIILSDKDPLPLFGLRLLSAIVERNPAFVGILNKLKLIGIFMEYFVVGHPRLNTHTIKLVKSILESGELSIEQLHQYNLIHKVNTIMASMIESEQDWSIDYLLDIILLLMQNAVEMIKMKKSHQSQLSSSSLSEEFTLDTKSLAHVLIIVQDLCDNFDTCVQLLASSDLGFAQKASGCIIFMLQLYGNRRLPDQREVYFTSEHLQYILTALRVDKASLQKRILKILQWGIQQQEHRVTFTYEQKKRLMEMLERFISSDNRSISTVAKEIYKVMQPMP